MKSTAHEVAATDRFFRRLLRIGDEVDKEAVFGARRATTRAIIFSGLRCTLVYLAIPLLAPIIGFLDTFGAQLSIILCLAAMVTSVNGARRFWIADHPARLTYSVFIGVMIVLLSAAVISDLAGILSA